MLMALNRKCSFQGFLESHENVAVEESYEKNSFYYFIIIVHHEYKICCWQD